MIALEDCDVSLEEST